MPIYNFKCPNGCEKKRRIMTPEQFAVHDIRCSICNSCVVHVPKAATARTMEVLDDGIQAKPIERLAESERIYQEREVAHDQKFKEKEYEEEG